MIVIIYLNLFEILTDGNGNDDDDFHSHLLSRVFWCIWLFAEYLYQFINTRVDTYHLLY